MSRRQLALLIGLLLTALTLRLAAGQWWQSRLPGPFGFGDSDGYWSLARATAHGGPYQYGEDRVFRMPGYPLLLAPLFLVRDTPPIAWGRAVTALAATAAVAAVGWLGWLLFGARAALIATALAAVYPGAVFLGAVILSEALFSAVLVAQLATWALAATASSTRRSAWLALVAGLLGGAATLTHPSWLLFTPFATALSFAGRPFRRSLTEAACVTIGLTVALAPWIVRNALVTGRLVPTTLQVGASLYDGLNPRATGASDMRFVDHFRSQLQREPAASGGESLEYRLDQRLRQEAMAWARQHPGQVLQLSLVKLGRMWNLWPNDRELSSWTIRMVTVFTYVPLLFFAIMGTVWTLRRGWPCWLGWLPAVYLTLLHMVFVGSVRYREPAMLPLAALAAMAIVAFWDKGVSRKP